MNFADSQEVAVERILKRQQLNPNCVHFHPNPKESVAIYAERIKEGAATFDEPIAEIWTVKDGKILNKKSKVLFLVFFMVEVSSTPLRFLPLTQ